MHTDLIPSRRRLSAFLGTHCHPTRCLCNSRRAHAGTGAGNRDDEEISAGNVVGRRRRRATIVSHARLPYAIRRALSSSSSYCVIVFCRRYDDARSIVPQCFPDVRGREHLGRLRFDMS